MADGDRHAYDNRTEGSKGLPPRPGHVATSVEAEIPLGPSDHRLTRWCLWCWDGSWTLRYRGWITGSDFWWSRLEKLFECVFYAIIFVQRTSTQFEILDFFIIWSCLVFRSRILVLFGRGVVFWGGMGSLKMISLVLLCRSSSDIPVFLSPHTPKKLMSFFL